MTMAGGGNDENERESATSAVALNVSGTVLKGRKKRLGSGGQTQQQQQVQPARPKPTKSQDQQLPQAQSDLRGSNGQGTAVKSSTTNNTNSNGSTNNITNNSTSSTTNNMTNSTTNNTADSRGRERKQGLFARAGQSLRSLSRSRASRASTAALDGDQHSDTLPNTNNSSAGVGDYDLGDTARSADIIITVTSCRSDAYHDQRAPGATYKLPRRAPSALKTFHELAVGLKDAYDAGGCMPKKPTLTDGIPGVVGRNDPTNASTMEQTVDTAKTSEVSPAEIEAQRILFDFMGNLDFLLALVDEVAMDTATRGALKEDTTFRGLRDVIKKCNKVLESMLVRRERKYTLLFRIVKPTDIAMLKKISHWNLRVENALGGVTQESDGGESSTTTPSTYEGGSKFSIRRNTWDETSDNGSEFSSLSASSARSSVSAVLRRGRDLLPSAGKVRARRATPTPKLRRRRGTSTADSVDTAAEDGYASDTVCLDNLAELQLSLDTGLGGGVQQPGVPPVIDQFKSEKQKKSDYSLTGMVAGQVQPMRPKDELLDVIRGLRNEQMRAREAVGSTESNVNVLEEIKSNFTPKAEIPSAVPKLPIEYIHRHRLMKQVVNCLLDRSGPRDTDDESPFANTITCITSRHSDKAGNGKTTLAVAAIQTVEVREFFSDGIAWIHIGRTPLGEREIRRLYEQLYDQLLGSENEEAEDDDGGKDEDDTSNSSSDENGEEDVTKSGTIVSKRGESTVSNATSEGKLAKSRRSFQVGELEGMKEDLARLLLTRKVLICLDDVCRMEDAKWFLFGTRSDGDNTFEDTPHRVLITTRIPGLVGPAITHEVFVRIFSEHEAVKLLLSAAGRRPNGLSKVSPIFAQARIIVKGCGNSPLALRIAGGMLRSRNRNWTLSSPAWKLLVDQCRTSLEEASKIRSFANSVQRLIDLSFATVQDADFRSCLRQCFVAFAMVFQNTDSLKVGKGISRAVVLRLFAIVSSVENETPKSKITCDTLMELMEDATLILDTLETMNLVQRAGHGLSNSSTMKKMNDPSGNLEMSNTSSNHRCYSMHESVKAMAEDMAKRKTVAFVPVYDEFNAFVSRTEAVPESSNHPLPFDEWIVLMLTGEMATMAEQIQVSHFDRLNVEEYVSENVPLHLIRAKMVKKASEFLTDPDFCRRRLVALGLIESTRRHVSDLIDLRRAYAANNSGKIPSTYDFDIVEAIQAGSSCIIDEVKRQSEGEASCVNIAICLSTMGEGLIKARLPREASQRLEEAVNLYRQLLGQVHIDVARAVNSLAKALVKLNETRAALIRYGEASSIYENCNFSHHFDSIANLQGMANLFVTSGDFQAAMALYENIINRKRSVHGDNSVATAKIINDYAVILAKNGKMEDALSRYEMALVTYEKALSGLPPSMSWLNHGESASKCGFDIALINLNIASIKSKKGDTLGAITSYERGVQGLRRYIDDLDIAGDEAGKNKNSSHMRHLVSALGRIGSLKLKLGDKNGALEAYGALFSEVDSESPMPSRLERGKAHIKCATIYRQSGEKEDNKHAILHLREALNMYTELYGPKHKDTLAVATSLGQWIVDEDQNPIR